MADGATQTVTLRAAAGAAGFIQALRSGADEAASRGDEAALDARISIGKSRARSMARALLDARDTDDAVSPTSNVYVLYCSSALSRLLSMRAVPDWERLGLALPTGRVVLALCDAAGYLAGPSLEVVGVRSEGEPRWLEVSRAALRRFEERAGQQRTLHAEESVWAGAPRVLTPEHLRVEQRAPGLDAVAAGLARMRAELAAAYLASTAQDAAGTDGDLLLRFAGPRPCTCRLPSAPDADASAAPGAADGSLARLAAWAYQHGSPDKLAIARECLAAELPAGGEASLAEVERVAGRALEAAKANFVLYLRHNSAAYFQRRQQALDAVSAYAETVRKAVGDLTGEVVDAVYRTAGLLLAVVIAGLIQPAVSLDVQRLACMVLTAYVLFVLFFLMRSRRQRYELESADLDGRLGAMTELSTSERERLRGRAAAANALFERYFRLSQAVYVCLAVAGALYFVLLLTPLAPHIALPHASPTPTAAPR
jgi:hypothetical protein